MDTQKFKTVNSGFHGAKIETFSLKDDGVVGDSEDLQAPDYIRPRNIEYVEFYNDGRQVGLKMTYKLSKEGEEGGQDGKWLKSYKDATFDLATSYLIDPHTGRRVDYSADVPEDGLEDGLENGKGIGVTVVFHKDGSLDYTEASPVRLTELGEIFPESLISVIKYTSDGGHVEDAHGVVSYIDRQGGLLMTFRREGRSYFNSGPPILEYYDTNGEVVSVKKLPFSARFDVKSNRYPYLVDRNGSDIQLV